MLSCYLMKTRSAKPGINDFGWSCVAILCNIQKTVQIFPTLESWETRGLMDTDLEGSLVLASSHTSSDDHIQ